ncbi:MAG: hypothetical protein ACT6XY_21285, partial [Phreatobacter sp.]|uniref:hypothetical protein n=1 Tax=Phreatobacter sp. TaxID=1966341 RepID=UPI0040363301
ASAEPPAHLPLQAFPRPTPLCGRLPRFRSASAGHLSLTFEITGFSSPVVRQNPRLKSLSRPFY